MLIIIKLEQIYCDTQNSFDTISSKQQYKIKPSLIFLCSAFFLLIHQSTHTVCDITCDITFIYIQLVYIVLFKRHVF